MFRSTTPLSLIHTVPKCRVELHHATITDSHRANVSCLAPPRRYYILHQAALPHINRASRGPPGASLGTLGGHRLFWSLLNASGKPFDASRDLPGGPEGDPGITKAGAWAGRWCEALSSGGQNALQEDILKSAPNKDLESTELNIEATYRKTVENPWAYSFEVCLVLTSARSARHRAEQIRKGAFHERVCFAAWPQICRMSARGRAFWLRIRSR